MPGTRLQADEIVNNLRQADVELTRGSTVAAVCTLLGITDATSYNWQREYGDSSSQDWSHQEPKSRRAILSISQSAPYGCIALIAIRLGM